MSHGFRPARNASRAVGAPLRLNVEVIEREKAEFAASHG